MGTTLSGGVRVVGAPSECESTTPEYQLVIHPRHCRSMLELEVLPDELVELVLDALHGDDLARCECACKRLRELAGNDQRWLRALARDFGASFAPPVGASFPRGAMKLQYAKCRETLRAIVRGRHDATHGLVPGFKPGGTRIFVG
jgi:hypothetical protein